MTNSNLQGDGPSSLKDTVVGNDALRFRIAERRSFRCLYLHHATSRGVPR